MGNDLLSRRPVSQSSNRPHLYQLELNPTCWSDSQLPTSSPSTSVQSDIFFDMVALAIPDPAAHLVIEGKDAFLWVVDLATETDKRFSSVVDPRGRVTVYNHSARSPASSLGRPINQIPLRDGTGRSSTTPSDMVPRLLLPPWAWSVRFTVRLWVWIIDQFRRHQVEFVRLYSHFVA